MKLFSKTAGLDKKTKQNKAKQKKIRENKQAKWNKKWKKQLEEQ